MVVKSTVSVTWNIVWCGWRPNLLNEKINVGAWLVMLVLATFYCCCCQDNDGHCFLFCLWSKISILAWIGAGKLNWKCHKMVCNVKVMYADESHAFKIHVCRWIPIPSIGNYWSKLTECRSILAIMVSFLWLKKCSLLWDYSDFGHNFLLSPGNIVILTVIYNQCNGEVKEALETCEGWCKS
jgi:hypothetical protein